MKLRNLLIKTGMLAAMLALMLAFAPAAFAAGQPGNAGTSITAGQLGATGTTGASDNTASAQEGESEEDLARRKEVYTMVALITAGAIIVGIRNKRGRR